jgi:hypothetical protein
VKNSSANVYREAKIKFQRIRKDSIETKDWEKTRLTCERALQTASCNSWRRSQ